MATLQQLLYKMCGHEHLRQYLVFAGVATTLVSVALTLVLQIKLPVSPEAQQTAADDGVIRQVIGLSDEPGGVEIAGLQIHEPGRLTYRNRADNDFITVLDGSVNAQDCPNPHVSQQPDTSAASEPALLPDSDGGQGQDEVVECPQRLEVSTGETAPIQPASPLNLEMAANETSALAEPVQLTSPTTSVQPERSQPTPSATATVEPLLTESPRVPLPGTGNQVQLPSGTTPAEPPEAAGAWQLQPYTPAVVVQPGTASQLNLTGPRMEQGPAAPDIVRFATEPGHVDAPHVEVRVSPVGLKPESQQHVASLVRRAIDQAERGALYLSRQQLLESLRSLSWMLDRAAGGRVHDQALSEALLALDEADDFSLARVNHQSNTEVDNFIIGHGTTVLKHAIAPNPIEARDSYYHFARDTFVAATGSEPIAAQALYALARVEAELRVRSPRAQHRGPREVPLYEAALAIYPQHSVAANELGVALARDGRLQSAVRWFLHSAQLQAKPQTLANLSKVYSQLGDHRAASQVQQKLAASRRPPSPQVRNIPLVTLEQFNAELRGREVGRIPAATNPGRPASNQPAGYFPPAGRPPKTTSVSQWARRLFSGQATRAQ